MPVAKPHRLRTLLVLLAWLAVLGGVYLNQQRLIDWWKLRGYTPPTVVATIASDDTMTDSARHLFYVNKPTITSSKTFSANCPQGGEKTVVLGCYKSGDDGIFLYDVTDDRLRGVVEVTAAHEMLHAAYERLSNAERARVDGMLRDYYEQGLLDERVIQTIAAYQKTEPTEIENEMHSIFATEVIDLPAGLETYYKQYFGDRKKVAKLTASYQAEFTSRQDQVSAYDAQLSELKQRIESNQAALQAKHEALGAQQDRMDRLREDDDTAAYNALVGPYNQAVNAYNTLLGQVRTDIETYNTLVEKRNTVALETKQLTEALSAQSLPSAP